MSPTEARRIVLFSMVLAATAASINDAAKRKALPRIRYALAPALAAAVLSAASDLMPEVAAFVAIAVATTALLDRGTATVAAVNRLLPPVE